MMTDRKIKIATVIVVLASLAGCVVATRGIMSLHQWSAKFDDGRTKAIAHCASIGGEWLADHSHAGYDHPTAGPGYCLKPDSILFAYPTLEK